MIEATDFVPPQPCGAPTPYDDSEDAPKCMRERGHAGSHIAGNDWAVWDDEADPTQQCFDCDHHYGKDGHCNHRWQGIKQSNSDTLLRLWPIERIERLEEIAAKPDAGENKIFVLELLDALKRALYGGARTVPTDEEIESAAEACFDGRYIVGEFMNPEQKHFWKDGARWMRGRIKQANSEAQRPDALQ